MHRLLESHTAGAALAGSPQPAFEVLGFSLGTLACALPMPPVREIRAYETPTRVAGMPEFVKGVLNLRGAIVPIIDLRLMFGCERCDYDALTVVIVLEIGARPVGLVVDRVDDVIELDVGDLRDADADTHGLVAGWCQDGRLMLLDSDALMRRANGVWATPLN
jgi:purine-binding chemotaxis protein CheW